MRLIPFIHIYLRHCFCLMGITALLALNSCKDETSLAKVRSLESELSQNNETVTKTKQELKRLETQIDAVQRENSEMKGQIPKLEQERDEKSKALETLKQQFEEYKAKYKLTMAKRVPGMQVADFSVSGKAYSNVTLTEMTESHMNFKHAAGLGRVELKELPEPLRDKLGLNIVLQSPDDARLQKSSGDPRNSWNGQLAAVAEAEAERISWHNAIDKIARKITDTKSAIEEKLLLHKPVDNLKRSIGPLESELAKAKSQLASAEVKVFEARAILSRMHPPKT